MERKKIKRRGCRNPKAKGSAYERHVCKRLSLWVSRMKRTDVFWRSASSGGRFTQMNKGPRRGGMAGLSDEAHAGDISLTHESGATFIRHFVVECKHRREADMRISNLIFGRRGGISKMWDKLKTECTNNRKPMLVCRQNCQPEVVLLDNEGYRLLRIGGSLPPTCILPQPGIVMVLMRDLLMLDFQRIERYAPDRRVKLKED